MARSGVTYPQVEPGVEALLERRIVRVTPSARVRGALARCRRADARVIMIGGRAAIRRDELERAGALGLGYLRVADLAWHDLPAVGVGASEISARRLLADGAAMIRVRRGGRVIGVVDGATQTLARPALSVAHRLDALESAAPSLSWLLRLAGKIGEAEGVPIHAVGGLVRDVLRGRPGVDVDLVVEGDGPELARRLAPEIGGRVRSHPAFGTATIEDGRDAGGRLLPRIDVASARRERYPAPGALPEVTPAPLADDLLRRDFSVHALAIDLGPARFGRLRDLPGAERDLARRRLRPLHPLSFVEDPTRVFRAARYSARLGFRLAPMARRAISAALAVRAYPALSGARLRAEIEILAGEPSGGRALERLLAWGALRLWDRGYRASPAARRRAAAAWRFVGWTRAAGVAMDHAEVILLALLLDQPPAVRRRCLVRLGLAETRARRLASALAGARVLARRLGDARRRSPSAIDALLRGAGEPAAAAAWFLGGARARRRVQWFLAEGRATRPALTGDDVVRLGVRPGPAVGLCLGELRRRRLDGDIATLAEEQDFVHRWSAERRAEKGDGT